MATRGRFAPSPTGSLHMGNARTALLAWLQVRSRGGTMVLRMEDLDRPRTVPGADAAILEELRWLGLDWDEGPEVGGACGPYAQSERTRLYDEAIDRLMRKGLLYECYCTRADIARAASAPHGPAEEGPRYPGTCRGLSAALAQEKRREGRAPALRFRLESGPCRFEDEVRGAVCLDPSLAGDFVVRRADGLHAYQLAVALDDALMGVTHVLRGADLLASTPRQIRLLQALELPVPRYAHVPLMLSPDGTRLSKRQGDTTLSALRARGVPPQWVVGLLARSCGLGDRPEVEPRSLVAGFDLGRLPREPSRFDARELFRSG